MPGPEIRVLDDRRSSLRGMTEPGQTRRSKSAGKERLKDRSMVGPLDAWIEPALDAPKPSYQDQGAGPYGVLEHMQPLGEAPNTKARARGKVDGLRKSVLGRSSAAAGPDERDTPECSPAPTSSTPQPAEMPSAQAIITDDDRDGDYAPEVNGRKRERVTRHRAVKSKTESPSLGMPSPNPSKPKSSLGSPHYRFEYEEDKLRRVVDAAMARAREVGKPEMANAVYEVYLQSLENHHLRTVLEAVLAQTATTEQNAHFLEYVRAAKKKVKAAKNKARQQPRQQQLLQQQPEVRTNRSQQNSVQPPSPAKLTLLSSPRSQPAAAAIPSTETPEPVKPRISLKVKSPAKGLHRIRATNGVMSLSPRKRAGSVGSDSSLTSLTSNEDATGEEMDLDDPGTSANTLANASTQGKAHAAEGGYLAVASGVAKRTSAEVELEQERDRTFAAKKQKLNESVYRDGDYEESNIRLTVPASRLRTERFRDDTLARPSLRLEPKKLRLTSARGSRAASTEVESPLSDPQSTARSRPGTPALKTGDKPTGKRAKTKQSPEKKQQHAALSGISGVGGAATDSPIGDDDNEELSENNDFCEACHSSGYLLCCDGCNRSFHFSCLDPPLNDDAKELNEPWFCYVCVSRRPVNGETPEKVQRGLFAQLLSGLKKRNPQNFELPQDLRDYFEGVATDRNGSFVEALNGTKNTRSRPGYSDEQPDYYRLRDSKGNLVLCYSCGKTSQNKRAIVTCDYCTQHWHLDCLDPPLANPPALSQNGKKVHDWMCPLHADLDLRRIDTALLNRRTIHLRKPKNPRVVETSLRRGFQNNGIIEVVDDDTDGSGSEFYEHEDSGTVFKLPAQGIKLDFIDKVKSTRVQQMRDERASQKRARAAACLPSALQQANFARRSFNEKQVALQLAQFASQNRDLNLGGDQVESLVAALISEAPPKIVDEIMAAEMTEKTKSTFAIIPPSPPASEQPEHLSSDQRRELYLLQELIRRKLENNKL